MKYTQGSFWGNFSKQIFRKLKKLQIINVTIKAIWYFFLLFKEKVPTGKSTNMVHFPKEKVPYSTWYFFPPLLFPIHHHKMAGHNGGATLG